jgi:hypothetical protein
MPAFSSIGSLLKSAAALAGSLGAIHTLAGATAVTVSTPSPLGATVGVAATDVVFGVTGTANPPSSWSFDAIPPGMNFDGHTTPGTYNVVSEYGTTMLSGTPTAAGTYAINLTAYEYNNGAGLSTAPFSYTVDVSGPPVITTQPAPQTVNAGASPTLSVTSSGATSYQWQLNGSSIVGATNPTLSLTNIGTTQAGSYTVVVNGLVTSSAAAMTVNVGSSLYNISSRAYLGSGTDQNIVAGFYTNGSGSKNVVLGGIGPDLAVIDPALSGLNLTNPKLTLFNGGGTVLATNTAWGGSQTLINALASVYAPPLPTNSNDTVIFTSVPAGPGIGYTAEMDGLNNTTGIALIEAYDYDSYTGTPASNLINISTRAFVGTGNDVLVAGFWTIGSTSQTLLIRAVGPGLAASDPALSGLTLVTPTLTLYDSSGKIIATNTGWGNAPVAGNSTVAAGIQPATTAIMNSVYASSIAAGSTDCAMVVTLPSNAGYTVQVNGVNSTTGVALVEVYNVP